jgi:hypothetical protein
VVRILRKRRRGINAGEGVKIMHRDEVNAHIILAVFGDSDPVRALNSGEAMDAGEDNPISPVAKAFDRARFNHALDKTKAASIDGWNEELGDAAPAPKAAKPFVKSSEERFAKACAALKKVFGEGEDYEAAVTLARRIRDEAVAEIVANF